MGQIVKNASSIVVLLLGCVIAANLHAETPLMNLPGQYGVGSSGASTYSIPIVVPPGTAGLEPALSLEYSSQTGNGDLGLGWSLSGLPAIERCGATHEQDGFKGGINYNGYDRFCLNGERLVAISGTYGASNTEYRTELESFSKIVSYGTAGSGPEYFKVWTKEGQIMEFGNSSDSRLMTNTSVHRWHVNKVSDTAGNYMTMLYSNSNHAADHQLYIIRIDYTYNAGLSPSNAVTFDYIWRPDQVRHFHAGVQEKKTLLLGWIRTFHGGTMVNDYRIAYSLGNDMRPSRIQSIALCEIGGNCLPATTFTWPAFSDPVTFTTLAQPNDLQPMLATGDFNGDGLPDFLHQPYSGVYYAFMSATPGNWSFQSKVLEHVMPYDEMGTAFVDTLALTLYPADVNGDGYTDGIVNERGTFVSIYDPSIVVPFGPMFKSVNINDSSGNLPLTIPYAAMPFGDLNGDGRDDQLDLRAAPHPSIPYYSLGDGTFIAGLATSGLHSNSSVFAGDFNGDGCIDALSQGGTNGVFLFCGVYYFPVPNWVSGNHKLVLGDYNGDGMTDVLVTHSTNATSLMLSTGLGFVDSGYWGPAGWAKYQIHAADFNGDGRSDLALMAANTAGGNYGPPMAHQIYLSTGAGFVYSQAIGNSGSNSMTHAQDYNGDGAADLWIYKYSGTSNLQYTTNYQPMLLTAVDNGLGAVTTFTYKRLNDNTASPVVYTKGTGATYPALDLIGAQYVVSQVVTSNGIGSNNTYEYQYKGGRLHQMGRGFLGFQETRVRDVQTQIDTVTTYRQDFPFIGRVASATQTHYPTGVVLQSTVNTYAADALAAVNGGHRRFVKLTQSVAASKDLNGATFPTVTTSYNAYDAYGNPTSIVVASSGGDTKTTTNVYSNDPTLWLLGRLTSTTTVHALSGQPSITRKASFAYQPTTGLLTQEVIEPDVAALRLTTDYGRDASGNITTITRSGADIATEVTTQTYDAQRRFVTSITNALNHTESFGYHPGRGFVTQHTDINGMPRSLLYDGYGLLANDTDAHGRYHSIYYYYCTGVASGSYTCPANGALAVADYHNRWSGSGGGQSSATKRQIYDRLGRLIADDVEGLGGALVRISYEYNEMGLLKRLSRPYYPATETPQWTTNTYDVLGRITDQQYPDGSHTTFTYNGLTTTSTNDKGQTVTTLRNAQNQVYRVTEPGSMVSEYLYNAVGDMSEAKDPGGNKITHVMDTRGRVTQSQDPSLGTWNYQYTVLDQLKQQTDAKSQVTTLTYDKLSRVTQVVAPGLTSTFTYDTATKGIGQLAMMETSAGNRRTHTYDAYGRPSTTTLRVDAINYTYTSTYDADGRLYTVQYPSGFTARYEYTPNQGYLLYVKNHADGTPLWTANARNAQGQYTQATQGNGVIINRAFNAQTGRISTIKAGILDSVANYSYAFDTLGNLTSRTDATQSLTETFQYDNRNRLTHATIGATTKTVTYNAVGNILGKTRLGSTNTNSYTYPLAGQPRPYAVSGITGVVNGVTNPTFTYDANGNRLTGGGRTLTWTSFNKVATITEGSTSVAFVYDAEHQRLKQTSGSNTIVYLNDPISGAMSEKHSASGGTWKDSIFADGERISVRTQTTSPAATSFQYFVQDHLGSVAVVMNQAGGVVQRLAYDAWGMRRHPNGTEDPSGAITAPTSRGYTDHEHLDNVDLINMNARLYDPETARFLSPDSIIPNVFQSQALNRYSYVYNNPGKYTDPSGHCAESISCVVNVVISVVGSLNNFFGGKDDDPPPPPKHHLPGIASVNQNMAGAAPIYDVSPKVKILSRQVAGSPSSPVNYQTSTGNFSVGQISIEPNGRPGFVIEVMVGINYASGAGETLFADLINGTQPLIIRSTSGPSAFGVLNSSGMPIILWNPEEGLKFSNGGAQSPAIGLAHEGGHAYDHIINGVQQNPMPEIPIIQGVETRISNYYSEGTRQYHYEGTTFTAKCVTCNY